MLKRTAERAESICQRVWARSGLEVQSSPVMTINLDSLDSLDGLDGARRPGSRATLVTGVSPEPGRTDLPFGRLPQG